MSSARRTPTRSLAVADATNYPMLGAIAVAAQGFSPPDSKVLALRGGGISNEALYNGLVGLNAMVGAQGWLAPKSTMELYGPTDLSDQESFCLRALSGVQLMTAATMIAAETDLDNAVATCWLAWGLSTAANVPLLEKLDVPKGPLIGSIAFFGVVGELTRRGMLNADLSTKILAVMLVPVSIAEIIAPQQVLDTFSMPQPSPLAKSLFENFSFTKLCTGLFLVTTKLTGNRGLGLAAGAAGSVANCVKTLTRADAVGLKKPGLLVWTVVQSAVALLAFKNELA